MECKSHQNPGNYLRTPVPIFVILEINFYPRVERCNYEDIINFVIKGGKSDVFRWITKKGNAECWSNLVLMFHVAYEYVIVELEQIFEKNCFHFYLNVWDTFQLIIGILLSNGFIIIQENLSGWKRFEIVSHRGGLHTNNFIAPIGDFIVQ